MRFGPYDPAKFPLRLPPPQPPLVVLIRPQFVGEPTSGLWCDACALPSAWSCAVELRLPSGAVAGRGRVDACTDCGNVTFDRRGAA